MSTQTTAGTPLIVQVTYDPGSLSLTWAGAGIGPSTACQVTLTGGVQPAQYPATGTSATIQVTIPATGAWAVSVAVVGGATSASVPVVATSATLARVQNLGASLDVAWTRAAGTTQSAVQLLQQGSGQSQSWIVSGEQLTIEQAVTRSGWEVRVRGAVVSGAATSYGPGASAPVLAVATQLTRVANSGSEVQLVWAPLSGYTRFLAVLDQGGPAVQSKSVTGMSWTFAATLSGDGWRATVSAQSADGISIGPPAPEVAVIVVTPLMLRVAYLTPSLTLTWSLLAGQASYAATLFNQDGSTSQTVAGDQASFTGPFSGTGWSCSVRAQSADGVSIGPPSTTYQPIFSAPTLNTFAWDGAQAAVTWTNAPAPAPDNLLSIATAGTDQSFSIGTTGTATVQVSLSATAAYTAVIYATSGIVLGPPSNALVPITAPPPAIATLTYDGTTVSASWSAVTGVAGYTMTLYDGTTRVDSANTTDPQGSIAAQLDPTKSYTVRVRATNGASSGPESAAVAVLAAAPTIASVAYDGTNVSASWSAVTGASGYTMTLYDGTTRVDSANTTDPQGSIGAQLDPTKSYTVRVRATNGASSGPESAAVAVLAGAPTIAAVAYDGTNVTASWSAVTGAAGYTLTLYDGTTRVDSANTTAPQGSIAAQLDPTKNYTVRVRATNGTSSGPESAAVAVLAAAPTIAAVAYDGTNVSASWSAVTGVSGYTMTLYDGTTRVDSANTTAPQGSIAAQLDPTKSYTVRVRATNGTSSGPESAAVAALAAAPTIASVAYDGTNVTASWSAVTGVSGYTMTLYDGTTRVDSANTTDPQGSIAAQLDPTKSYTVRVRATNGTSSGPESAAVAVLVAAPTIASVAYDGTTVSASWSVVTGASGYTMTLYDGTTRVDSANTNDPQGSIAAQLDPTKNYTVRVRATNGTSSGPESAAVAVLVAAPTIASVAYDGTTVSASWSVVTGASGYTMTLYDGTTRVDSANTTALQGSITATLDPTRTYTVRVRATNSAGSGPESTAVTVIIGAPTLTSVSYDGTSVAAAWSAVAEAAVTGYTLAVYDGTTVVNSVDTTDPQGSVTATLDPAKTYTARAWATGGHGSGPPSAAVTILTAAPTGMQLDYDGTALVAGWQAVDAAPGYTAELQADGTPVETQQATGTTATFTRALASGVAYTARARVSAPPALGPWSAPATGPYLAAVTYGYDPLGRLTSVAMPAVILAYTYDDAGNILTAARTVPAGGDTPQDATLEAPTP